MQGGGWGGGGGVYAYCLPNTYFCPPDCLKWAKLNFAVLPIEDNFTVNWPGNIINFLNKPQEN